MVMPCSRSALRPSIRRAGSKPPPVVPWTFGVAGDGGELVLVDHAGVVEQAADEGRLAVVHGAAGQQAQQVLLLVLAQVGGDVGADQFLVGDAVVVRRSC